MKKMKFKRFLICAFIVITSIITYNEFGVAAFGATMSNTENEKIAYVTNDSSKIADSLNKVIIEKELIKNSLVAEVENFIDKKSPNAADYIPSYIVEACLRENIDICFCMAQTQIETNYGTTGAGRSCSRKSMFGVKSRVYENYCKAIDDYINILKKNYLGKGKTEQHLMKNYVNHGGYRYASSHDYEINLSNAYRDIDMNTRIKNLQKQYNEMNV